jgi:hypothetical protein
VPNSKLDDDQGMLFAHLSSDGGATWHSTYLMNRLSYGDGDLADRTMTYSAGSASVAYFPSGQQSGDGKFHVVWHEENGSSMYIRTAAPGENVVTVTTSPFTAPSGSDPSPVISFRDGLATIVYATSSGLMKSTSTDNGATWSTQAISGTTSNSIRPSIATTGGHDILAWQDSDAGGAPLLYYSIDGGTKVDLTSASITMSAPASPSVSAFGTTAHIVWPADFK